MVSKKATATESVPLFYLFSQTDCVYFSKIRFNLKKLPHLYYFLFLH